MYTKQWAFQLFVHNLPCAGVFFREDGKPQFHLLTKSFASILLKLATGACDTLEGVEVWLEVASGHDAQVSAIGSAYVPGRHGVQIPSNDCLQDPRLPEAQPPQRVQFRAFVSD
jgi:hypothetical protein